MAGSENVLFEACLVRRAAHRLPVELCALLCSISNY